MKKTEAISILATSVRPREPKDRARYDEAVKMAIEALKCSETPKSSEQNAETAQADHIADSGKKVERTGKPSQDVSDSDLIFRKAAIEAIIGMIDRFERILADIRASKGDGSVCGMCEYDGAYMGQSGDWCNECPGFDKDDCFKLSDRCRKRWMGDITLPSAQPEHKRGEWIGHPIKGTDSLSIDKDTCSHCGERFYQIAETGVVWNFCPNCGADMRKES